MEFEKKARILAQGLATTAAIGLMITLGSNGVPSVDDSAAPELVTETRPVEAEPGLDSQSTDSASTANEGSETDSDGPSAGIPNSLPYSGTKDTNQNTGDKSSGPATTTGSSTTAIRNTNTTRATATSATTRGSADTSQTTQNLNSGSTTTTANPVTTGATSVTSTTAATPREIQNGAGGSYAANLELIRAGSVRNQNHDSSPYRNTPQANLVLTDHYGPRSEYLGNPAGNTERAFPVPEGGQFRISCEFSHFAYDDPIVYPGQPGRSHLHMYWGNTDVNAMSDYNSLINSGSSTCNGQELNRSGYWAPAMFDANGNVRIPERIDIYYKGYGLANGRSQPYPANMAMIAMTKVHETPDSKGGAAGETGYRCSDQWRGARNPSGDTIPNCNGSRFLNEYGVSDNPHVTLEMSVKFPQCWDGTDPSKPSAFALPQRGGWFYSECDSKTTFPTIEYIIQYRVEIGENTSGWYLASDVNPANGQLKGAPGATNHADWWGGWHPEVNQMWLDNCTNFRTDKPSGCGQGYLTDGGPDGNNPYDGPALKFRPQYTGPSAVPAATLYRELCDRNGNTSGAAAAYCYK